jgi:DNA-binding HxlR family transcriptional regulator/putative sterol carrier protein
VSRRTYNQYCATARALDIVGERWTLLLVRELLTGPKRFSDLLANLPGMGTGLLAARLKHLQDEGLIRQVRLPAPAGTPAYELTEAGADLEPAVLALARWGMTWVLGERAAGEAFRPGWAVLAMESFFDPDAARDVRAVYEFRVDGEVFYAAVDHGRIESAYGPAQRPDTVIETDADVFIKITTGRLSIAEAMRSGVATVSGDRRAARKLPGLFRWPPARARTPTTTG